MTAPHNVVFDRRFVLDWRSLSYPVGAELPLEVIASGYKPRSYTWSLAHWFDQGSEGACVGFAIAHELAARPQVVVGISDSYAFRVYKRAQKIDPWEGENYSGTSVLAGAQIAMEDGFYESYHWALSIEELALGLGYFGPCVLGIDWYEGMDYPDAKGFLHPVGRIAGGHAIAAIGVKIVYRSLNYFWRARTWADVDLQRSYVLLHNSWGRSWGADGRAKISLADLERLLMAQGDAMFPKRSAKTDAFGLAA